MKLIRGIPRLGGSADSTEADVAAVEPLLESGSVLTVGAFDGIHKGHQAVLSHLIKLARQRGVPSVVLTLEPLPREYFAPLSAPPRLMSFREKFEAMAELGVDYLVVLRFNKQLRNMNAEVFTTGIYVQWLRCELVIIGDDFRFGRDGEGDFELLQELGKKHNFSVQPTSTLCIEGGRVSSTRIRELLQAGDFEQAEQLLGRPYSISGRVVYGRQLGRTLGVPTVNIQLRRLRAAMSGVYAVTATVAGEDRARPAVANVGTRPTVDEGIKAILEVHLLDFDGDLYGKRMVVQFCHKIRDERKFDSIDLLREQMQRDIEQAREWFKTTPATDHNSGTIIS